MTTLSDLQAKHPDWCFQCGDEFATPQFCHRHQNEKDCNGSNVIAALVAAKMEDEERITTMEFAWDQDARYSMGHFNAIKKLIEGAHYADAHSYLDDLIYLTEKALARQEARKKEDGYAH